MSRRPRFFPRSFNLIDAATLAIAETVLRWRVPFMALVILLAFLVIVQVVFAQHDPASVPSATIISRALARLGYRAT
jgi:hypothetical protein